MLFTWFINDITEIENSRFLLFADHTAITMAKTQTITLIRIRSVGTIIVGKEQIEEYIWHNQAYTVEKN